MFMCQRIADAYENSFENEEHSQRVMNIKTREKIYTFPSWKFIFTSFFLTWEALKFKERFEFPSKYLILCS